jgi:CDGSH-type Zn-finger protein
VSNVVTLPKREPLIWVCTCGCSTFRFFSNGTHECASCGIISDAGEWMAEKPAAPVTPRETERETRVISFAGSPQQAMREMLRKGLDENILALVAIGEDSRVRTWGGVDTKKRSAWLGRRLKEARELLTVCVPKAGHG